MVDEIFDRNYQAARAELHEAMKLVASHLASAVGNSFKVLQRIEYSAPWDAQARRSRCN